ncbi:MAG TPA: elongation factor P--(R)-beta-lysine ligase [Gammaproteobacteria bacterium]|nr:elongation factor P--(R)-beta-lysine ligase [Gammaproteobacteria bacterium]
MSLAPKNKSWKPSAQLSELRLRADVLNNIRAFFAARHVLEVETPLMCSTSVTDPFIESIPASYQSHPHQATVTYYLQTSPEYAMKRLLAADSGSIFQLCKSFRQGEQGRLHNPEFTMLEWYRIGFDHLQLMHEVDELLQLILRTQSADRITYQELFFHHLNLDAFTASLDDLRACAKANNLNTHDDINDRDTWLNLLLTHCIEPKLGPERPCMIYDFPASQSALARINADGKTAARFEVYYHGMELANGFHELQNADEQRRRFELNNKKREAEHLKQMPIDELFLQSLANGFPDCAGVALGVDRLVMLAAGKNCIQDVISFDISRV